jgi:hypothetical protein
MGVLKNYFRPGIAHLSLADAGAAVAVMGALLRETAYHGIRRNRYTVDRYAVLIQYPFSPAFSTSPNMAALLTRNSMVVIIQSVIRLPYWRKVMKCRLFSTLICVFLFIVIFICLPGCEGAGKMDRQVRDELDAKLKDWNQNGFPIADPSAIGQTKANLKEWRFKYAKLFLVFDSQKAHPVMAKMVLEAIAMGWYGGYPANIKPRFILEVRAFHDIESHDNEWGVCKVLRDGSPETHWYPTDVY